MKRLAVILLALCLCLTGCKKKPVDISGLEQAPEGVDWRLWDTYTSATLTMGEESIAVLMGLDAIHLVVFYDQDEQKELTTITIIDPLSDVEYSRGHLRILDQNQDGYDDICIPDMLDSGDRVMNWWLWDTEAKRYRYSQEYSQTQEEIGGDISWMEGKNFVNGVMDIPGGSQDLLILVEENQILVYLDDRDEVLWGTAQIPQSLSAEDRAHMRLCTFWECWDVNGDEWGDLQMPYRWEESGEGSICQYNYVWLWDSENGIYTFDAAASSQPVI